MGRLHDFIEKSRTKKLSAKEYYQDLKQKIHSRNQATNALLEIFDDVLDNPSVKTDTAFLGAPIAIKDMISMKGRKLQASSRMLEGYRAPRSATVAEKLEQAGANFIGRANCDEFAMGSSNENTPFGPVRNPFRLTHTAGGSSGGSAASVAAEMCVGSLGTDTGGSIRLPAAFCGLVGLKPTYGRVSRSGVIAFASSLDQVGPFADDALDCAYLLQAIAGVDERDSTTMPVDVTDYVKATQTGSLKGLKIGLPKEYFSEGLDPDHQKLIDQTKNILVQEGASLVDVSIPHTPYGIAVYYLVATAEAASNLSRYDGIRYGHRAKDFSNLKELMIRSRSEGFGPEVKRRIMLGTFALSSGYYDAYYQKAQFVRAKIQQEFLTAFQKVDLMFTPVSPTAPFELGSRLKDPMKMYLSDIFTVSINLAGVPAISFCIGHDSQKLPVGGQLIGRPFAEAQLLSAVAAFERAHPIQKATLAC